MLEKEKDRKRYLDLPGGRVNIGETLEGSFFREIQEELIGLKHNHIKIVEELLFIYEMPQNVLNTGERILVIFKVVECSIPLDYITISKEHANKRIVDLREEPLNLTNLIVLDGYMKAINKFHKGYYNL